jgi:hypothetical protein
VKSRIRSTACASRPCRIPTSSSTI